MDYYGYDSSVTTGLGVLAGMFIGLIILLLVIYVIAVIAMWKIFSKGGKPGWGSLIPIYNVYLLCDMVGVCPWWILVVFISGLLGFIPVIGSLINTAAIIYFEILIYVSLARAFGKENSYAIGLFFLPIVFLPMLAFGSSEYQGKNPMKDFLFGNLIKVGGDNSNQQTNVNQQTYQQPDMNNNINNDMNNNMNMNVNSQEPVPPAPDVNSQVGGIPTEQQPASKFCPYCGAQVDANSSFCPACGKQVN